MYHGTGPKTMARFNEKIIPYETQDRLMDVFCYILTELKTKEEKKDFLKDLLNRQERIMLIRRLMIAELLSDGKNYSQIAKRLKCGKSTIARVQRWLNFGRGGYKKALKIEIKK